jgi:hypothetical protein
VGGGIKTLDLVITRQIFYHCAAAIGRAAASLKVRPFTFFLFLLFKIQNLFLGLIIYLLLCLDVNANGRSSTYA